MWRIADSQAAPKFNVVSKPNDWSRTVNVISDAATPKKRVQIGFWSALMKRLDEQRSPVKSKKPQLQGWIQFSIGRSEFGLEATLQSTGKWISVHLFMTGSNATAHYRLLERQREQIKDELGDLEWRALQGKKSSQIRLRRTNTDPMNQEDWPNQLDWMVSTLEAFDKTFRPRIKGPRRFRLAP